MSCPEEFSKIDEYLKNVYAFLEMYKWVYYTSNTCYLKYEILDKIPIDWRQSLINISTEHFNMIPFGYIDENWPQSLKEFLLELKSLKPIFNFVNVSSDIQCRQSQKWKIKGVSPKKIYEINYLSEKINCDCLDEVDVFIDLGSGLGYISQILYEKYNYKVLGLESDPQRVETAKLRQAKMYPQSITTNSIHFVQHIVSSDSENFIKKELTKCFQITDTSNIAIIGLHACGDLTNHAINLFLNLNIIKNIIIMPCCYHKISMKDPADVVGDVTQTFENNPLSKSLINNNYSNVINRPFLRLAAQQTASHWKNLKTNEHNLHGTKMFERAILNCIICEDETLIKRASKTFDASKMPNIFQDYTVIHKHSNETKPWTYQHIEQYNHLNNSYLNGGKLSEILTCFQTSLQVLCENIVLLDKVCFVKEKANELSLKINIGIEKIMDDEVSPRCYALIGSKI